MKKEVDHWKRQDFLWIVQSTYLANGINTTTLENDIIEKRRHELSGLGVKNEMCDAVKASYLIPDELDAVEAADEYISWKLFAQRENNHESSTTSPNWITPGFKGWK
ncbi:hypothetical protein [Celeribacter halophilus]|uniref:hypothetical protein n=1 Tax=Celeribacter halophilus TaxID=576117 RepID=UPI003A94B5BE